MCYINYLSSACALDIGPKPCRVTGAMKSLHWLPVRYRIRHKLNTLTYKAIQTGQPSYLASYLKPYTCIRQTRRSNPNHKFLDTPNPDAQLHKYKSHTVKSFCFAAPQSWNNLPTHVRTAGSLNLFRGHLKAYLFSQAYPP